MSVDMSDYVEVHDRIAAFYEKHPEGSLQSGWEFHELGGQTVIVVEARAYRTPDDPHPGIGLASEPVPGKTPYTRDSELMNAETSAWGRAIAALGFEVKRGIASANEVRNRQGNGSSSGAWKPSDKQLNLIERKVKEGGAKGGDLALLTDWARNVLTGGKQGTASTAIDSLMDDATVATERLLTAARKWAEDKAARENVDDSDLPPADAPSDEGTEL